MDYVQNVLARQRQLLSLLLLGREQETKQETEWLRQTVYSGLEEQVSSVVSVFGRHRRGDAKQPEETSERFWPGASAARFQERLERSMAARRQAETQVPQQWYRQMPESGTASMTGGEISGDGSIQAGGAWSAAAADGSQRDALAASAAAGGGWQGALSARAVSLAFERDARRYDGGFSLY